MPLLQYEEFMTFDRYYAFNKDSLSKDPLIRDISETGPSYAFVGLTYKKVDLFRPKSQWSLYQASYRNP